MKSRDFYRHKAEKPLIVISIIISLAIFIFLAYLGYEATIGSKENILILQILGLESDLGTLVVTIGGYVSIIAVIVIVIRVLLIYEESQINAKAYDVYVSKKHFSMLIKAEEEYAKKLGIKKLPTLFVANEKVELEFAGAKIDDINVIRIPCIEIIATADKNYYSPKFTIAKHLAGMYLGYYNFILSLLVVFANWIPVLRQVGNRVIAYSTDKLAAELVGKDNAINAIIEESVDIWFLPYMDVKEYLANTKEIVKDKNMFWANVLSDTPIPAYRIEALRNGTDGKLF